MSVYLCYLAIDFGIQWLAFVIAATLQTEKFYDLTGSLTFAILSVCAHKWSKAPGFRKSIQTGLILLWTFRLGTYLFSRILRDGKDRRFDNVRNNPKRFFVFWTLQGVWVFVLLLPSLVMINNENQTSRFTTNDLVGWLVWLIGFLIEAIADRQKQIFREIPANKDKFIRSGLWSVSRHPNYFGEILLWFGLLISASSGFSGNVLQTLALACCPIFNALLIICVSGIPLLEKSATKKWSNNYVYEQYVRNTAVLIPYVW